MESSSRFEKRRFIQLVFAINETPLVQRFGHAPGDEYVTAGRVFDNRLLSNNHRLLGIEILETIKVRCIERHFCPFFMKSL